MQRAVRHFRGESAIRHHVGIISAILNVPFGRTAIYSSATSILNAGPPVHRRSWGRVTIRKTSQHLRPLHAAYHDIDDSPSLQFLVRNADKPPYDKYLRWSVEKRPAVELYDVEDDFGLP